MLDSFLPHPHAKVIRPASPLAFGLGSCNFIEQISTSSSHAQSQLTMTSQLQDIVVPVLCPIESKNQPRIEEVAMADLPCSANSTHWNRCGANSLR